jgi:hypothetical protein
MEKMLQEFGASGFDDFADFQSEGEASTLPRSDTPSEQQQPPPGNGRLRFYSDREFLVKGYTFLAEQHSDYLPLEEHGKFVSVTAPRDLKRRLGAPDSRGGVVFGATAIPVEAWPGNAVFRLTDDPSRVEMAIQAKRNTSGYWADELLCSEAHPILQWVTERLVMQVPRDQAPFVVTDRFAAGELCFCFIGQVSSVAGSPIIVDAHAVSFGKGGTIQHMPL